MEARREETELQPRVTLDEAMLAAFETFRNGCNFRLRRMADGSNWLEYGCYGVHVNLSQGSERLLMQWVGVGDKYQPRQIDGLVKPETIVALMKREPCRECGGMQFQAKEPTP